MLFSSGKGEGGRLREEARREKNGRSEDRKVGCSRK